jgi:tRNA(fMet)-specific endonuclease VapC
MRHLDTNIIVPVLRGNDRARELIESHLGDLAVSAFVVAELRYGARKSNKVDVNLRDIEGSLELIPIVPFDADAADAYSRIRIGLESIGRRTGETDLLIASVALTHGATLITRNVKHFEMIDGLSVEDGLSP